MSGITGIFRRDGKDVDPADIKKMNDKIAHRGPDGSKIWCEGPIAFGHQMLYTTPESLHEELPFEDEDSGLVITADARIDNRKELAPKLGIEDNEYVSDSYFILKAYEKWGEKCPDELLGDFAFVIWDKNQNKLFCARDHMGVKPFYYYLSEDAFFFSSEIKTLFIVPEVPYMLNEKKLAFHLLIVHTDDNLTFYENILSLEAAHYFSLTMSKDEKNQYWKLDKDYRIDLDSEQEYIKNFREIFEEAVLCRLRTEFNIGFELSGGLDSSSIVCMAHRILNKDPYKKININTYSLVFDNLPQVDEQFYIDKVIESYDDIIPHKIRSDNINPLDNIDDILWQQEVPFYTINMSIFWNLYNQMTKDKIRIVFSGSGGDETVISYEKNYLYDLASKMQWIKLFREVNGYSKRSNKSRFHVIFYHIIIYFIPTYLKNLYKKVTQDEKNKKNNFILNEDFVNKVGGKEYLETFQYESLIKDIKTFRDFHYFAINNSARQMALEMMDLKASYFSIETRYPFFDKRLIEFCYAIPDEMKFHFGWNRYILRVSMENILPLSIQWRPFKKFFDPLLKKNLLLFEKNRLDNIFKKDSLLEQYIDLRIIRKIYKNFSSGLSYKEQNNLWIVIIVYIWLVLFFLKNKKIQK